MLISVVGAGYVGLVTAACLAEVGNRVRVIDRDANRIALLERGETPFHEPGLHELIEQNVRAARLSFHEDVSAAGSSTLVIVAVGTLDDAGAWTEAAVREAVSDVARRPELPRLIAIRSTLLPGSTARIADAVAQIEPAVSIGVNPEFTREGTAVQDFMAPDRVIIGVADGMAGGALRDALVATYRPLSAPVIVTDWTSAESIKVASNVFLAAKVAFANELARLCAATGADVRAVIDGVGADRRIGRAFLTPGPGYGGSCLPSQARALPGLAQLLGVSAPLMQSIDVSNGEQACWYAELVTRAAGGSLRGRTIALLGTTFKAGTDDLRESPALRLGHLFASRGARLRVYDPIGGEAGSRLIDGTGTRASALPDVAGACHGADVVVVATEWPEFAAIDWEQLAKRVRVRTIVDARNVIDRESAQAAGWTVLPKRTEEVGLSTSASQPRATQSRGPSRSPQMPVRSAARRAKDC